MSSEDPDAKVRLFGDGGKLITKTFRATRGGTLFFNISKETGVLKIYESVDGEVDGRNYGERDITIITYNPRAWYSVE